LPIALDAFAASALFVSYRLPGGHKSRRAATRTARLALTLTVVCNGLDHLLDLAGYLLTKHVRDLLLVAVASLPPLIVERLLHLQTVLVDDDRGPVDGSVTVQRRPLLFFFDAGRSRPDRLTEPVILAQQAFEECVSENSGGDVSVNVVNGHIAERPKDDVGQTGHARAGAVQRASSRPAEDRWVSVAERVYREVAVRTGRRPTESSFHAALTEALVGAGQADIHRQGPNVNAPMSLSTAKRIRALVEADGGDVSRRQA
jgi:hypothetical protein